MILYIIFNRDHSLSFLILVPFPLDSVVLMDYGTAGFAVHHQFPELAQTHVHAAVTIPKNVEGALQTGL